MVSISRAPHPRRLASLTLVALLGAVLAVPGHVSATTTPPPDAATISAEESAMVGLLNADRAAAGLVAVRIDSRLMAIARARSVDMVTKNYFSHTQPDGRNVFNILSSSGVTWYNAGEIIAWNTYPMDSTTSAANRQWMGSAGHHAIIVSTDFNYVGVGLAVTSAGKKLWTAVFIKGPDRTGARATVARPAISAGTTATSRKAKVTWGGADVRLQVLTSGLRSFTVQRRADGGTWYTVWSSTTLKAATFNVGVGHLSEFRISAVDNRGNRGAWSTTSVDLR